MLAVFEDDLSGESTRRLLALHLLGMRANSPPGSVHALDLSGLRAPGVTVWSVREDGGTIGVGALRTFDDGTGEVKSMRTHPDHLRRGIASLLLDRIVAEARTLALTRLSLETGSGPEFEPALTLYRKRGFVNGEAFSDYRPSAFNQFLHMPL